MTTVYFIRHAKADYNVRDDRTRPLTEKGLIDRLLVTEYLQDKNIDIVCSSPYKRTVDTVSDFAAAHNLEIEIVEDFREAEDNNKRLKEENAFSVMERLWADFSAKETDGEWENRENLAEVQMRSINALNDILMKYKNKNIVIGTHGVSLSTIINYYETSFALESFMAMVDITPWVVKMTFNKTRCTEIETIDLFVVDIK
jgi:2,3-bisphosphoglycerate-dependent phosphoglycerate mutase